MKHIIKIAVSASLVLLFFGCSSNQPQAPTFNPNNKHIVFVEGKSFRIPYLSNYKLATIKKLERYDKQFGCRKGDLQWMSNGAKRDIAAVRQKYINDATRRLYSLGHIGCAQPMSNQEYQYYMNQQNQQQANARARMQAESAESIAFGQSMYSLMPQTYNVTGTVMHTGTVNVVESDRARLVR